MKKYIGGIIYKSRKSRKLTQDEFGEIYGVSGPAIFKFEKGYVRPSLKLWLKIAADLETPERWAVLVWLKSSLPEKYKDFVELKWSEAQEVGTAARPKTKRHADYRKCKTRDSMIEAARGDASTPAALLEFLEDDEMWALYKPSGKEVNGLIDNFANLGRGSKPLYRQALGVLRGFTA